MVSSFLTDRAAAVSLNWLGWIGPWLHPQQCPWPRSKLLGSSIWDFPVLPPTQLPVQSYCHQACCHKAAPSECATSTAGASTTLAHAASMRGACSCLGGWVEGERALRLTEACAVCVLLPCSFSMVCGLGVDAGRGLVGALIGPSACAQPHCAHHGFGLGHVAFAYRASRVKRGL